VNGDGFAIVKGNPTRAPGGAGPAALTHAAGFDESRWRKPERAERLTPPTPATASFTAQAGPDFAETAGVTREAERQADRQVQAAATALAR